MSETNRIAATAALIGDAARANMLAALLDGRALTAKELAYTAHVTPQTASGHLAKLATAKLLVLMKQGRRHYYRIASPLVGQMLESIMAVASAQTSPLQPRPSRMEERMRTARTCYDHLAGRRGVQLRDRLLAVGAIRHLDDRDHELTDRGQHLVERLDIDLAAVRASRRVFARSCIDWTDRRIHLAGALPAAITSVFIARGWLGDAPGRSLHVAERFDDKIDEWLAT